MDAVEDGALDPGRYQECRPRIAHLLKNPTQYTPSIPDLVRKAIEKSGSVKGRLWLRLARRSYGLLNGFADWKDVCGLTRACLAESLLQVALVNVAYDEDSTPSKAVLGAWAKAKLARWHGRILAIMPNIVLCGGTFYPVWRSLGNPTCRSASTGMRWFRDPEIKDCVYLDTTHPSHRYPVSMVHTYLMASARDILSAGAVFHVR